MNKVFKNMTDGVWELVGDNLDSIDLLVMGENEIEEQTVDITKFNVSNIIQIIPGTIENGSLTIKNKL